MLKALKTPFARRLLRGLTATVAGGAAFGGMSAAGYVPGTETELGVDASVVRDAVTGALTVGSLFLPQLGTVANIVKSLGNHRDVEKVACETNAQFARLDELDERVAKLEAAFSGRRKRS